MQTLRKFARAAIAVIVLAAISDVIIFHRHYAAYFLRYLISLIPEGLIEIAIALVSGLGILILYFILRQLAYRIADFAHHLWNAPGETPYYALEPKDRISFANALRANRIQVITTTAQILGGTVLLIGVYFSWANLRTVQEGQITVRFTKAIDQLGATDNKGNPRLNFAFMGFMPWNVSPVNLKRITGRSWKF